MRRGRELRAAAAVALLGLLASCATAGGIAGTGSTSRQPIGPAPSQPTHQPDGTPATGLPAGFGQGPPGKGLARFYDQRVTWTPCGGDDTCAAVWVPLDYAKPDG